MMRLLLTPVACMSCAQWRSLMAGFWSSPTARSEVNMFLTVPSTPVYVSQALISYNVTSIAVRIHTDRNSKEILQKGSLHFVHFNQKIHAKLNNTSKKKSTNSLLDVLIKNYIHYRLKNLNLSFSSA